LVLENQRDLPVESEALYQIGDVFLPVKQTKDEHLYQDESCVDGREDAFNRVLPGLAVFVSVILVRSHGFKAHSI